MESDVVIVPGGGLTPQGGPSRWVTERLNVAAKRLTPAGRILCLSRGTVHKPPPLDPLGFPYSEARQSAAYLVGLGVSRRQIWIEDSSLDTVGNAFFSRICHMDLTLFRRILVVTSDFHMARTRAIFEWVYGLEPASGYELSFEAVPNVGLSSSEVIARGDRERASLANIEIISGQLRTMSQLHEFIFAEHSAYSTGQPAELVSRDSTVAASY